MRGSSQISDKKRVGPGNCEHVNEIDASDSVSGATWTRFREATEPSTREARADVLI